MEPRKQEHLWEPTLSKKWKATTRASRTPGAQAHRGLRAGHARKGFPGNLGDLHLSFESTNNRHGSAVIRAWLAEAIGWASDQSEESIRRRYRPARDTRAGVAVLRDRSGPSPPAPAPPASVASIVSPQASAPSHPPRHVRGLSADRLHGVSVSVSVCGTPVPLVPADFRRNGNDCPPNGTR